MERNREWTSFFNSQHQYSTCSLASTTFELRSSDDFILEGRAESERLLSAQIMIFYHGVFKTLANSFLNITTFLFFSFLLSSCTFHMRSIFEFFKRRVSKQKRRFTEGGFDLDLTCILFMCGFARIYGILPSFFSLMTLFGQKFLLDACSEHGGLSVKSVKLFGQLDLC